MTKLEGTGQFRQEPKNSLINKETSKFSDKVYTYNNLNYWVIPMLLEKEKFTLMKKRNDFELIKILA